jgi:hypothetical protein
MQYNIKPTMEYAASVMSADVTNTNPLRLVCHTILVSAMCVSFVVCITSVLLCEALPKHKVFLDGSDERLYQFNDTKGRY